MQNIFYLTMHCRRSLNRKTKSHVFLDSEQCICFCCLAMQRLFHQQPKACPRCEYKEQTRRQRQADRLPLYPCESSTSY